MGKISETFDLRTNNKKYRYKQNEILFKHFDYKSENILPSAKKIVSHSSVADKPYHN
jgi:hypothetical protein